MKKTILFNNDQNKSVLKILKKKILTFISVFFSFSIQDYYSTTNFLKFRFKIKRDKIKKLKGIHKNETIFMIGAGPSLNDENLNLLNDKIVIAYNFSFQALENVKPKKIYSVILGARLNPGKSIDRKLFDESFRIPGAKDDEIIEYGAIKKTDIILPTPFKYYIYKIKDGSAGFSYDISKEFRSNGGSSGLLSCAQIASYMGANKIVLLGADFDCKDQSATHFSKANFEKTSHWDGKDHEWYKLKRPEIFRSLERLKNLLKQNGIEFINASSYTSEKVLDKKKLNDLV